MEINIEYEKNVYIAYGEKRGKEYVDKVVVQDDRGEHVFHSRYDIQFKTENGLIYTVDFECFGRRIDLRISVETSDKSRKAGWEYENHTFNHVSNFVDFAEDRGLQVVDKD